jgi:hypothetical protein
VSEETAYRYIEEVLNEIKNSIKDNEKETISNIRKMKEKLTSNNEKLKLLSDMLEKSKFYGDFIYETISKLVQYNYDTTLFKYLKLFTDISDGIVIDTFNYSALIYFYLKVSKDKNVEFSQIEIDYNENKYNIVLSRNFNIDNTDMEQINKALINILLNIEQRIKEEDEDKDNEEDNT